MHLYVEVGSKEGQVKQIDEDILALLAERSWTCERALLTALRDTWRLRGKMGCISRLLHLRGYEVQSAYMQAPSARQLSSRLAKLKRRRLLWHRERDGYGLSPNGWQLISAFSYRGRMKQKTT